MNMLLKHSGYWVTLIFCVISMKANRIDDGTVLVWFVHMHVFLACVHLDLCVFWK